MKGAFAALFWLALWQMAAMAVGKELLLPAPTAVLARLAGLVVQGDFWVFTAYTMLRIMVGFLAAVAVGVLLAVATHCSALADALLRPLLSIVRVTPVASFILLALVWMRTGVVPAFCTFLMVLPGVWANVSAGINNVDTQLLEMARVYRLGSWATLKRIYIPSVMPYFIAAFNNGLGLGWKAGIAAEVICRPESSIGIQMYYSKLYLETIDLFAWTAVVIAISIVLERLFASLGRRAGTRYNVE